MTAVELEFPIPPGLGADRSPEDRGIARDAVRLLVSDGPHDKDRSFHDLPEILEPGDLLVVNESATIPASLAAEASFGRIVVNLSTRYGRDLWLVEPRWGPGAPGPLPLAVGDRLDLAGTGAELVAPFPGVPRLWFLRTDGDLSTTIATFGQPIRYGYLARSYPLDRYQTLFARVPGSAEMPSAGGPFTDRLVRRLQERGVRVVSIVLHTGVSSLEVGDAAPGAVPVYPEPFEVPAATVWAIAETRRSGGRVVAVGTTVVRALESSTESGLLRPTRGFTRLYLHSTQPTRTVDGILTGFHDGRSTHLELLAAVAGSAVVRRSYRHAVGSGYLWHEFGDAQLLWAASSPRGASLSA